MLMFIFFARNEKTLNVIIDIFNSRNPIVVVGWMLSQQGQKVFPNLNM
jgi:hypothetical protein